MIDHIPREFIVKSLTENQKNTIFIRHFIQQHIIRERCIEEQCREISDFMIKKGYLMEPGTIKHYYYKDLNYNSD